MSVETPERKQSKIEFDNAYYRVHDDAVNLVSFNFGAKGDVLEANVDYIRAAKQSVLKDVFDLCRHLKMANSIYPTNLSE